MFTPNYTITNEILNKITDIEVLRSKVMQARILPERAVEMRYRATVEKVHNSTSIEGNPLTMKQVDSALKGESMTRSKYAETEVRNYKKALDQIDKRKLTAQTLKYEDILELHKLAMKGLLPEKKTGALRTGPIYIVDQDDKLKYTGPGAGIVKKKLEDLLNWLSNIEKDVHTCITTAILHYQFVSIHPFADGNGRVARLIVMLYLGIRNYDFNNSIVLDSFYAQEREEYYEALHKCQGKKYHEGQDLTSWITYFIDGFLSSAKVLGAEITILSTLDPVITRKHITQDKMDILNYVKQFESISLSEAEEILPELSRRTVQRKLRELTEDGYLKKNGVARNTRYYWNV